MKHKLLSTLFVSFPLLANGALQEVDLSKKNDLARDIKAISISEGSVAPKIVTTQNDEDGGDGVKDGAIKIDSKSVGGLFGAELTLGTVEKAGMAISLKTNVFNFNKSYVKYDVQIFNKTKKKVMATTEKALLNPKDEITAAEHELSYTTVAADKGDELVIRWVQTSTDNQARDIFVDNVTVKVKATETK